MIEQPININIDDNRYTIDDIRTRVKEYYTEQFLKYILEDGYDFKESIKNVIDNGYCCGYNIVLEVAERVLSKEDYRKIIDKLNKLIN